MGSSRLVEAVTAAITCCLKAPSESTAMLAVVQPIITSRHLVYVMNACAKILTNPSSAEIILQSKVLDQLTLQSQEYI